MSHPDWPTFVDVSQTYGISLHTLRRRFTERKVTPGIEVWREGHRDPYRINPDHVGVLLDHGNTPPWRDPQILAEEYMFMCSSFRSEERAVKRLSDAYGRSPKTITRALKKVAP